MNAVEKLNILGAKAKWDACSSGSKALEQQLPGVYPCTTSDLHNCNIMKVLQSNKCVHDCKYCVNTSKGNQTSLEPKEIADTFEHYVRTGAVNAGLFLSSGVDSSADNAMERMIETARMIRGRGYRGYMHLKVLPGASKEHVKQLALYGDRLSVNLESVNSLLLNELSSTKDFKVDLIRRLRWVSGHARKRQIRQGHTTQFIVGAGQEMDMQYMLAMNKLYKEFALKRTYFSAFEPVEGTKLDSLEAGSKRRENFLYRIDWLMRVYRYETNELLSVLNERGNLPLDIDPKLNYAILNADKFPVDVKAPKEELIKVPGIGPRSAERINELARKGRINSADDLYGLGRVVKRALPFLKVGNGVQRKLSSF